MRSILALAVALAFSSGALAQPAPSYPASAPKAPAKPTPRGAPHLTRSQMDAQIKSMQEMHEKMVAAKTPEERQALMADHMKVMQDGMAVMGGMHGPDGRAGMPMNADETGKRLDMMEMMMQMMLDREAARTPAGK